MNLSDIQRAIQDNGGDGWLFFDIHQRDHLAYRILGLDLERMTTRRWYYYPGMKRDHSWRPLAYLTSGLRK